MPFLHHILRVLRKQDLSKLSKVASWVRDRHCGRVVFIRGLLEFSNYCCRSCLYCGLRRENRDLPRYRMSPEEILEAVDRMAECGVKTVVLQSGDDLGYPVEELARTIRQIKERYPDMAVTLSIGERSIEDYRALRQAGADRFLLKHETANPELYHEMHPGQSFMHRLRLLLYLRRLGYQIGAGCIVGLPGQTLKDLAADVRLMYLLDVDMAGIGPFVPQKNTPLGSHPPGSKELTLSVLALTRILTKTVLLPATTALATLDPVEGHVAGLRAGCNVIMVNFTPERYRQHYRIYDNKLRVTLSRAEEAVKEAGLSILWDRGDTFRCSKHRGA